VFLELLRRKDEFPIGLGVRRVAAGLVEAVDDQRPRNADRLVFNPLVKDQSSSKAANGLFTRLVEHGFFPDRHDLGGDPWRVVLLRFADPSAGLVPLHGGAARGQSTHQQQGDSCRSHGAITS
jgi:hypothetical protein